MKALDGDGTAANSDRDSFLHNMFLYATQKQKAGDQREREFTIRAGQQERSPDRAMIRSNFGTDQ